MTLSYCLYDIITLFIRYFKESVITIILILLPSNERHTTFPDGMCMHNSALTGNDPESLFAKCDGVGRISVFEKLSLSTTHQQPISMRRAHLNHSVIGEGLSQPPNCSAAHLCSEARWRIWASVQVHS